MKRLILFSILSFLMILLTGCSDSSEQIVWENLQTESDGEDRAVGETERETVCQICVDLSGAVAVPGVYLLEEGARVYQAVEMAGGLLEDADRNGINLAAVLKDGEKIRIYTEEEAVQIAVSQEQSDKVNLNTADVQTLCTLTGIGEARAKDIIAYRETNGSFQSVEEIMNVSGIKETTFQKIKDKIVVE